MRTKNTSRYPVMRPNALILVGIFFIVAAAVVLPSRSVQSGSRPASSSRNVSSNAPARVSQINTQIASNPVLARSIFEPFLPFPQSSTPSISTYDTDCTTPKTDFNLGDSVCAKATGVPSGLLFPWRVSWVDTAGFVRHSDSAIADDAATYTFTLPATTTSIINDQTVDNRGTWSVNLTRSNGAILRSARFTVHETANPQADVFVQKLQRDANDQIHSGDNVAFIIVVGNAGPDAGSAVHLVDSVPSGATLVSFTQNSGPACDPSGSNDCTITTLVNGDRAEFTAIYNLGSIAPGTYETSATVSTTTPDSDNSNDTSTAQFVVQTGSGGATCELTCPTSITVTANTVEGGQSGAHVSYPDPESSGSCGSITTSPASGSFFPVGTTIVTATSATGGGSCSFSVDVEDSNANVSISCPANKQATADANCGATVSLGNPTTTGANVTITVSRSDGKAMYDCDTNGENCVRKTTDLPFPAGITIVTWTATSHDTPGPYANPDDEVAHRTGNASCQQTVTVDDVTPPTITAANQTASANANCQAAVPDFSTIATVSDNCACASSDTSQICDSRQDIVVTQDVAPGTLVGLGPHTIQLTANDGSSNNGGAGNSTTISVTFTVNDTTAPVITCPANILNVHTEPGICAATVNPGAATAADNCSAPTIAGVRSDAQALNAPYPKGTTTITWTATDAAGNHSSCVQTITVIDVEPPTISCQANIIADFNPAVNGATVNYTAPVGVDNCPGSTTTQIAGLPSGATFPTGTTTNTFKVTDASGNTAQCSFKVTVALTSIIGLDSVTITGSGYADSYDSTGGYPATKGSLANVLSNGTITIGGSGKVWGNVRSTRANVNMTGSSQVTGNATAGTTVTTSGSATVLGTRTNNALAPVMTLPAVPACGPPYSPNSGISGTYSYNASTGDLTLSGTNIATLANGNYCFHNVTLGNSGQLKVNGLVVIKLTGTLNTSGATSLNNTTQIPSNLRILSSYSGSNGVVLGNSASVYALVYSPKTGLNLSGSAPLFGTFAGKTLIIGNSGAIHYDTRLKTVWPDIWTLIFGP